MLVRLVGSGLCHSDEHLVTGDLPFRVADHRRPRGAGVVEEVGAEVDWLAPGDHVIFGFIPSCGRCPSCATGHSNLCDLGAYLGEGKQISDHTARHHAHGTDLGLMCLLGTFAERTVVNEASCIKVEPDVPLDKACLLGCGVVTGWGSAVYAADVGPGDDVAVVGHRRHRHQRRPGRQARRRPPDLRHRPGAVQAGTGAGVRGHPHGGVARGGPRH